MAYRITCFYIGEFKFADFCKFANLLKQKPHQSFLYMYKYTVVDIFMFFPAQQTIRQNKCLKAWLTYAPHTIAKAMAMNKTTRVPILIAASPQLWKSMSFFPWLIGPTKKNVLRKEKKCVHEERYRKSAAFKEQQCDRLQHEKKQDN